METKKDSTGKTVRTMKKNASLKKPFYMEKWFYAIVAVALLAGTFGAGVAVGSSLAGKSDDNDVARVDDDAEQGENKDQESQDSNNEKDDNSSSANNSSSSSSNGSSSSGSSLSGSDASTSGDLMNDGVGVYAVGQTAKHKGYEVKVTKVERNFKPAWGIKPSIAGNDEFIRVTMEVKNVSNDDGNYSAFDWSIDSDQRLATSNAKAMDYERNPLVAGELAKGEKVTGTMVFEISSEAQWAALEYQPNFQWSDPGVRFELF